MVNGRVTLTDRNGRAGLMRGHVEAVARSIVEDRSGDGVFERYLRLGRHVRDYSVRNRMLIHWQAPLSRLVAGRSALDRMAAEQGHAGREFTGRGGGRWTQHVMVAAGARAIWIWGPTRRRITVTVTDPDTGEEREGESVPTGFVPVRVWAIEDMRYADTGGAMVAPDFVRPVLDGALHRSLLAFAAARGITISERGLHGARGVSMVGEIGLQAGDHWSLHVAPLIHELAHEMLHDVHARLTEPHRLHEAEAEAVAAVVLRHAGHPTPMSAAYLRHWGASPGDVLASMQRIAGVAGEIVGFIEERAGEAVGAAGAAPTDRGRGLGSPVGGPG